MLEHVNYIFVILTYRNADDLTDFATSVKETVTGSYKIVVVNSYYDDQTLEKIFAVAKQNDCDFINVENKGYSYGNNRGIEYAEKTYSYDYLIVSNPDIIVKKMELPQGDERMVIYGPDIRTLKGKAQNPYRPVHIGLGDYLTYLGYHYNLDLLVWVYVAINKILRTLFLAWDKLFPKNRRVHALHGSFIVFSKRVIETYFPLFYEKMFLFAEEDYLAYRMKCQNVPMLFTHDIQVLHKEDGSVGISNVNVWKNIQVSFQEYYKSKKTLRKERREKC